MGNIDSYGYDPTKQTKLIQTHPQYEVYQSQSGQQYQRYLVTHNGKQSFEQQCSYRINQKHNDFIQVLYVGRSNSLISCRNKDKYQVITERIPYRLNSLTSISFSNTLTILKCSLRGFGDLFTKYGAFNINQKMIGFNKRNKVKVWINSNFALNCPQEVASFSELSPKYQERQMVHGVFDLINSKTKASQWSELMYLKETNNPNNFGEALAFVQDFCRQRQFDLNASKQSISNIYRYNYSKDKIKQNEQVNKTYKPNPQYFLNKPAFKQPVAVYRQNKALINNERFQQSKEAQLAFSYGFPLVNCKQIIRDPVLQSNHIHGFQIKPKFIYIEENNNELQMKKTADKKKTSQYQQQTLFKENDALKGKQVSLKNQQSMSQQCINNPRQSQQLYERSENKLNKNSQDFLQSQKSIEEQIKLQQINEEQKRQILLQAISQSNQKGFQLQRQEQNKNSIIETENKFEAQKPTFQNKICSQLNQWSSLENIRGSINVSLVDTRQIKRKSIDFQEESRNQQQIQKPKMVSYRQMRRMLLQQLQA